MEIASSFSFLEKEWFEGSRRQSMNLHEETAARWHDAPAAWKRADPRYLIRVGGRSVFSVNFLAQLAFKDFSTWAKSLRRIRHAHSLPYLGSRAVFRKRYVRTELNQFGSRGSYQRPGPEDRDSYDDANCQWRED
jgi:hypothetical protein